MRFVFRAGRDENLVPFKVNAMPGRNSLPPDLVDLEDAKRIPAGSLMTGNLGHGGGGAREHGLDVNESGKLLVVLSTAAISNPDVADPKFLKACFKPYKWAVPLAQGLGLKVWKMQRSAQGRISVWDKDGRCLSTNAVEGRDRGAGAWMDRDDNIYMIQAGARLPAWKTHDGIVDAEGGWAGISSLVKFRGLGGKYPVGRFVKPGPGAAADDAETVPDDALRMEGDVSVVGALWAFPMSGNPSDGCMCTHVRPQMDGYARLWIPANPLCSVTVIDSNGNRVARIGRYGNVDDADPECGKIHFSWLRNAAASDTAMYAMDSGNRRILKAALSYAVEAEIPVQ
jgi:hypothetical protein